METLDLNIINKHFPELLSYKHLLLFYMSSNTFYKDKLGNILENKYVPINSIGIPDL